MKKILVAGSTGYLGQFVVKELKERGYWVRALARDRSKLAHLEAFIDEIVVGEVTEPETLRHICDDIDVVFSSIGITKQKGKLTFKDVDYQGNKNILDLALKTDVKKFIYVSVYNGSKLKHLDIVKAHELFVEALKASGIDYSILRPTGYFSDMGEFLKMAKRGRVFLFGKGENRMNPIHGLDLAVSCVDAISSQDKEVNIGGPQALSYREIGQIAFESYHKPIKITSVPIWLIKIIVRITKVFNKHQGELLAFFTCAGTSDAVAPSYGSISLKEYYAQCVKEEN